MQERRETPRQETEWARIQSAFVEQADAAELGGSPYSGALERKKVFDILLSHENLLITETIAVLEEKRKEAEIKKAPFFIEKTFFDVASEREIEYMEKFSYAYYLLEAMVISPEEFQELEEAVVSGKEATLDKRTKEIAIELEKHFNFPPQLFSEIAAIHQYFQFLIKKGKARLDDEVDYINERYGWQGEGEPSQRWEYWDDVLAKLNFLWRAHVLGIITQEDFERMVES